VEELLKKLKAPKTATNNEERGAASGFVSRVPRDKKWVRVQISEEIPQEVMKKLVKEKGLFYRMQKDGRMLVYGDEENIKSLVKEMAEQFRGARKG
jgi:hypothetical protein